MSRSKGRAASGIRPKWHSRAESLNLESLVIRSRKSGHESRHGPRRIRLGTKLQSRAKSLSLQSLDIRSGKSQNESRQGSRRNRI